MKKVLFVVADFKDYKQSFFEQHFSPRNAKFAKMHGYEYVVKRGVQPMRDSYTWCKFSIVRDMINEGFLQDGDEILHLDADIRIDKFDKDYPNDKTFAIAIDNGNTFCMGNYKAKVNNWYKTLVNDILDDGLYERNKEKKHWKVFKEQAAFYTLCGIPAHSWESFLELPDYGWHSAKTEDTKYSIDELHENVHVLGPEWDTTLLQEEAEITHPGLMKYYIVKSKKEDMIMRHFAGGQMWRTH